MSLINQVLKDLDARQAVANVRHPLPSAVRPLPPLRGARRHWWVAGGVVVALAGAALLVVYFLPTPLTGEPGATVASVAPALPVAAPPVPLPAMSTPMPSADSATHAPSTEPAAAPPATGGTLAPPPAAAAPVGHRGAEPVVVAPLMKPESTPARTIPPAEKKNAAPRAAAPVADPPEAARRAPRVGDAEAPTAKPAAIAPAAAAGKHGAIERSDAGAGAGGRADVDYRKAIEALNQGRVGEAIDGLRAVLASDPLQRSARQLLVKLLLEAGRHDEAGTVLREGLQGQPAQIGWAMALARLQVERGDLAGAWATLDASLPAASGSADYQGFAGNVLQRLGRSREAITRFAAATRLAPADGRWWLGLGLAHDAEGNVDEARAALLNARQCTNLSPELMALVDQKLR